MNYAYYATSCLEQMDSCDQLDGSCWCHLSRSMSRSDAECNPEADLGVRGLGFACEATSRGLGATERKIGKRAGIRREAGRSA